MWLTDWFRDIKKAFEGDIWEWDQLDEEDGPDGY